MKRLRNTLAAMALSLLATTTQAQPPITVIGDSLTSCADCWPEVLRDDGYHMRPIGRGGLRAEEYEHPPYLLPWPGAVYIYTLGINDAADPDAVALYDSQFSKHMGTLRALKARIIVLVPPTLSDRDMRPIRRTVNQWCAIVEFMGLPDVQCLDMDDIWDSVERYDGLHTTQGGARTIANFVSTAL